MPDSEKVQIAGAGPAGLAAAITLARAGRRVVLHEAAKEVGHRFRRDLQGLENWSTEADALDALGDLGVTTGFRYMPCRRGTVFDAWGEAHAVVSERPLFYLVERGPGAGSLDAALLGQALATGVDVRFNSRIRPLAGAAVVATGPQSVDAIAVGYHFETDMPSGFWAICDNRLAPGGYAYLLVMEGLATVKTCMFSRFGLHREYARRTVEAFQRLVGMTLHNPRRHGGIGSFGLTEPRAGAAQRVAGEQAGAQDALWGFGIRSAILSGLLAARSLLEDAEYRDLWRREIEPLLRTSAFNRAAYSLLGNRGYRWCLRRQAGRDAGTFLRRHRGPSRLKWWMGPLVWGFRRPRSRT
jgi:flavin-dependent dehydrogenase